MLLSLKLSIRRSSVSAVMGIKVYAETGAALASGMLEMGVMLCQATGRVDEIEKLKGLGRYH